MKLLRNIGFTLIFWCIGLISLLPLRVLYVFADVLSWFMRCVVRYRRKVIISNLSSSFPDKGPGEVRCIAKDFYRFLADYFVETVKLASMSKTQMLRRLEVENVEVVNRSVLNGRSVSLFLGHYCNWEWVSSLPLHIAPEAICGQIYHPLESSVADRIFLRLRSRFGAVSIKMDDTLRMVAGWYRKGRPSVVGYIADQVPGYGSIHRWVDFMNHDTPVFTGAERLSRMVHADCYYVHLTRPRRGKYVLRFVPICPDAALYPKFSVTDEFFSQLQSQIRFRPQFWLWSHRRWKRTRKRFVEIYGVEEAARRLTRL